MTREEKIKAIYDDQCTGTETDTDAQLDELMEDFGLIDENESDESEENEEESAAD